MGDSPKKAFQKNAQHFPLPAKRKPRTWGGRISVKFQSLSVSKLSKPEACLKGRKEKQTGAGTKSVCEKKGLRGQKKRPLPRQKARDAARPRVPVTLWLTNKPSKTQKRRGPTLRARGAPLVLTRARGGRDHPLPTSARSPTRAEKACSRKTKQNKRGKEKQGNRSTRKPLPPRVPRKGLRRFKENPKNARGPEWHPEKNAEKRDARPKRAKQQTRRDTKKRKGKSKTSACEGVSCYYLICISSKKTRKRRRRKNQRKRERTQKTADLTSREFFQTLSGVNCQKIKPKRKQKPTKKHKNNTTSQKQKFAPENFFKKRPLEEQNGKKRQKTPDQTQKTQKGKNGQHFPLRQRAERASIYMTVRSA